MQERDGNKKSYGKGRSEVRKGRNKGDAGMTDVNCKVITWLTLSKVNLYE